MPHDPDGCGFCEALMSKDDDAARFGSHIDDAYEEELGAPRKPRCTAGKRLCVPAIAPGPSGVSLRHGADCPSTPLARISAREYRGSGNQRLGWRGLR